MDSTMSAADIMALTKNNETGFNFGGVGGLILILLFFFIFGGGFWGNNSSTGSTMTLTDLERDVLAGQKSAEVNMLEQSGVTQRQILDSNYQTLLGFKDQQAQISSCCCENRLAIANQTNALAQAIHEEGEATRALITQNTIQDLRDSVAGYRETLSNANQTQNILSAIGRYVVNPYTPYTYGTYTATGGTSIM